MTTENTDSLQHIERSGFRPGEYIAYINGAQRVHRAGAGWKTYCLGSSAGTFTPIEARTLAELDAKIARMRQPPYVPTLARPAS